MTNGGGRGPIFSHLDKLPYLPFTRRTRVGCIACRGTPKDVSMYKLGLARPVLGRPRQAMQPTQVLASGMGFPSRFEKCT